MPLTPQDVRNKLFTPVRFKPGYDEDEVDAFLDEVEAELTRLHQQLDDVGHPAPAGASDADIERIHVEADERIRLALQEADERNAAEIAALQAEADAQLRSVRSAAATAGPPGGAGASDAERAATEQRLAQAQAEAQQVRTQLQQLQQQATQQIQLAQQQAARAQQEAASAAQELAQLRAAPPVASAGQAGPDVLPPPSPTEELLRRTLILAQRTADDAISEARAEADRLVGSARSEAGQTLGSARSDAEQLLGSAKSDADQLRGSAKSEADQLRGSALSEAENLVTTARTEAEETARAAALEHAERTRRRDAEHAAAVARSRAENEMLVSKLEELRSFERDYRSRLRAYLHLQLRDLEAGTPKPPAALAGLRTAIGTRPGDDGGAGDVAGEASTDAEAEQVPSGVVDHADRDEPLRPAPLYGHPGSGGR